MALTDSAEEARKNFEELQKLAQKLRKDLSEFNLGDTVKDAETVKELLKGWDKEFQDSIASLDSIGASFQQTVSEISKGNVGLNQTKKSFNKLTSLASDLTNHTRGYNKLSVKQLESITSQAEQEKKRLETTLDTLKAEKDYLTQQGASQSKLDQINAAISEAEAIVENKNEKSNAAYRDLLTNAQALAEKQGKVNNAMGLGGTALDGMVSAMDKMGMRGLTEKLGLDEAKKKMEEMADELTNGGETAATMVEKI
jgi:chromosome segregation ATPase